MPSVRITDACSEEDVASAERKRRDSWGKEEETS